MARVAIIGGHGKVALRLSRWFWVSGLNFNLTSVLQMLVIGNETGFELFLSALHHYGLLEKDFQVKV